MEGKEYGSFSLSRPTENSHSSLKSCDTSNKGYIHIINKLIGKTIIAVVAIGFGEGERSLCPPFRQAGTHSSHNAYKPSITYFAKTNKNKSWNIGLIESKKLKHPPKFSLIWKCSFLWNVLSNKCKRL